jgi:hypothetical protein
MSSIAAAALPVEHFVVARSDAQLEVLAQGKDEAAEYKHALGGRVTVVVVPNSAHAVIIEQPTAVSEALIGYAGKLWPASAPK